MRRKEKLLYYNICKEREESWSARSAADDGGIMTKDVLVTISGLQFEPGVSETPEPVEVTCPGTYYKKNGKHYVMYEEIIEGFSGVTKNTLKLQQDSLDIMKRGVSNVHMVFEKNKKKHGVLSHAVWQSDDGN